MTTLSDAGRHTFHIPVMGTGFTIDTPLKVARYGIASVVSLVDDALIEQVRARLCADHGEPYEPIGEDQDDARARRITAYLDLLHDLVARQVERVRGAAFEAGSEITRYFELLPPSPARALYERMRGCRDEGEQLSLQDRLRELVEPGPIDVNIMTKLDRDRDRRGRPLPEGGSDAVAALRGFMRSRAQGSVVLSAGMNRRLFSAMGEFAELMPARAEGLRKRVVLKVSDYRSALLQGKLLARLGVHVAEFRVESGLNCGGHAFGGKGQLLGPILEEFRRERESLGRTLHGIRRKALQAVGREDVDEAPLPARVTVQGGLGAAHEDQLLREHYQVDGTGWGTAFLFVPEVVQIDPGSLRRLVTAGEDDIELSGASPLGVPFWSLRTSDSEELRRQRVADGRPGSPCPKGYLVSSTEFTAQPICTASRAYQRRKLQALEGSDLAAQEQARAREAVTRKACICHDLAGSAARNLDLDPSASPAICCGPGAAYFQTATTLDAMVDHIYGRAPLPLHRDRPHMLLKELGLHLASLRQDVSRHAAEPCEKLARTIGECRENLEQGVAHYRELAGRIVEPHRTAFQHRLHALQGELASLFAGHVGASRD
jgi:hypothetical protein